ncbi:MAG: hypothetical protein ACRYGP_32005 [Janthinobacterium lividum]
MTNFGRNEAGSAARWFALSAAVLSLAGMAGARSLNWLAQSGHLAIVAYRAPAAVPPGPVTADAGIDRMPTGSIPSSAIMIRIR